MIVEDVVGAAKPSLLIEACKLIDQLNISGQNQDVQGDLYEYLLSKLNTAGQNGQFRTPRHVIRMMVKLVTVLVGGSGTGTPTFIQPNKEWQGMRR